MTPLKAVARLYPRRLAVLVGAFGLLAALALALALALSLRQSRQQALETAAQNANSLAVALAGTVARTAQSVDVLLLTLATPLEDGGIDQPSGSMDAQLRQMLTYMPHVRQLAVVLPDGTLWSDSAGNDGRHIDMAPLLGGLRDGQRGMVVGVTLSGRMLGEDGASPHRLMPFYRAVRRPGGQLAAIVVAAVNPLYFRSAFDGLDLPDSASFRLWRFDGTLLEGNGVQTDFVAGGHGGLPLFARHLRRAEFGTFDGTDDDGVERLIAYRTTPTWPLVVAVGVAVDDVLDGWRAAVAPQSWAVGAAVAVLLALTAALVRALARSARAEAVLRLSDRVLETMSNGVAIADAGRPDLPLIYVNPAFERMTGYPASKVLGHNARFLHGADRDQPGLDAIRKALDEGGTARAILRNYRADGSRYWNDLAISAVSMQPGRVSHFVAVQHDITEQEDGRANLRAAYARIERYSAELERFSFVMAHHLQEPARHVAVYARLIGRELADHPDSELRTQLEVLTSAADRLRDLLRDVQLYLAVDRLVMAGGVAAAGPVLDREWQAHQAAVPDARLSVVRPLPKVQVPAKRLAGLFGILIDNSMVFRAADRPLQVDVSAQGPVDGFWCFRFTDNGQGIPPEFTEKVFGVFERLHNRELFPGNGIGLAIARKMVETLGGVITAKSDGHSGTTIEFTLPEATE